MVIEYDKIIVNVPKKLLEEFDKVAEVHSYSRSEAIKEAMRIFVVDKMPEDYVPEQMREVMAESAEDAGVGLIRGMVKATENSKINNAQPTFSPQMKSRIKKQILVDSGLIKFVEPVDYEYTAEDEEIIELLTMDPELDPEVDGAKIHEKMHGGIIIARESYGKRKDALEKKGIKTFEIFIHALMGESLRRTLSTQDFKFEKKQKKAIV